MKRNRVPVPFTIVAVMSMLALSFNPTPSGTAPSDPYPPPGGFDEETELRELAASLTGPGPGAPRLRVFTPGDLDAALDGRPSQHELFPPYLFVDQKASRALLQRLPYGGVLLQAAERHKIDGLLLAAVVEAESRFDPAAVSPKGAVGLMQVMPATGELYGAQDLFDPFVNIDLGSRYLRRLLRRYGGDIELALAAYNAGPAAVARYDGVPPFRETRAYVARVYGRYLELCERVRGPRDPFRGPAAAGSAIRAR